MVWLLLTVAFLGTLYCTRGQEVHCTEKYMKASIPLQNGNESVYLEGMKNFKGSPRCQAKKSDDFQAIFSLPLDPITECGTTRMTDLRTGSSIVYHRVVVDDGLHPKQTILIKCKLPSIRSRRDTLPDDFIETEYLEYSNISARAPEAYINLVLRQNGQVLDTTQIVRTGSVLEMFLYLDRGSSSIYGLLVNNLKVTDIPPKHDEILIINGCSVDDLVFGQFSTNDNGKSLSANFKAFKFPNSNFVQFVGTVNICLDKCYGVPCNDKGLVGYGRKRRSVTDKNRLYDVEISTIIEIEDNLKPIRDRQNTLYQPFASHTISILPNKVAIMLTIALLLLSRKF